MIAQNGLGESGRVSNRTMQWQKGNRGTLLEYSDASGEIGVTIVSFVRSHFVNLLRLFTSC